MYFGVFSAICGRCALGWQQIKSPATCVLKTSEGLCFLQLRRWRRISVLSVRSLRGYVVRANDSSRSEHGWVGSLLYMGNSHKITSARAENHAVADRLGTEPKMTQEELFESRINKMISALDASPELAEALMREHEDMQSSVTGSGGSNSSGALLEIFDKDPYSLSRFR
jgi:hypothetical protein